VSESTLPVLLADRAAYKARLEAILPQVITGTTASANDIAAAAGFVLMYVAAIEGQNPVRPSTVIWMSAPLGESHRSDKDRRAYYKAAMRSERAVVELCQRWGTDHRPWYANNSREPLRDETFRTWAENGVLLSGAGVGTTSPGARYTLSRDFARLLDPGLTGDDLDAAINTWQDRHLSPTGRARAQRARAAVQAGSEVVVNLPGGQTRTLHTGLSSEILKGVIEQFAPVALRDPAVVFISQPGEKVEPVDGQLLQVLGLPIDQQRLLPDCLLADLAEDRDTLWLVEVVATDGPVTEERKATFLTWATQHGVRAVRCRFLTAFASRTAGPFKRLVPQLARGSYAWFLDEPDAVLSWEELAGGSEA